MDGGRYVFSGQRKQNHSCLMDEVNNIGNENQNFEKIFKPLFSTKAKDIELGLTTTILLTEANESTKELRARLEERKSLLLHCQQKK